MCTFCGNKFASMDNLRWHIKDIHLQQKVKCNLCPYLCRDLSKLKMHTRNHHKNNGSDIDIIPNNDQKDTIHSEVGKVPKLLRNQTPITGDHYLQKRNLSVILVLKHSKLKEIVIDMQKFIIQRVGLSVTFVIRNSMSNSFWIGIR